MIRKIIMFISIFFLTALAILGGLVYQASPGPSSQDILGVRLGHGNTQTGVATLSGRRLHCSPKATSPYTSTCSVTINDKLLAIQAFRNDPTHPMSFGGGCEATYDGQEWPCKIGSPVIGVSWYAYINDPLGLDAAQIDALRRQYFFENLPEENFIFGITIIPVMATMLVLLGWFARQPFNKHIGAIAATFGFLLLFTLIMLVNGYGLIPLARIIIPTTIGLIGLMFWRRPPTMRPWLTSIGLSLSTFIGTLFLALTLTHGLWD